MSRGTLAPEASASTIPPLAQTGNTRIQMYLMFINNIQVGKTRAIHIQKTVPVGSRTPRADKVTRRVC